VPERHDKYFSPKFAWPVPFMNASDHDRGVRFLQHQTKKDGYSFIVHASQTGTKKEGSRLPHVHRRLAQKKEGYLFIAHASQTGTKKEEQLPLSSHFI